MVTVTREFAERIAEVARLLERDELPGEALQRLAALGADLFPGSGTAAVTIADGGQPLTFAAADPRLSGLHELQFSSGQGPLVEALHHHEPRRVDDITTERRWPLFCRAAARAGFASLLVLPLRTDQPAGAVALYSPGRRTFTGSAQDVAVLYAAQGGTALHNAELYRACREMADNLHTALASQAVIEQAKGILHAELGVSMDEAFALLSQRSHRTNRKVRLVSADLVAGRVDPASVRPAGRDRRGGGHQRRP